jgi:diguanylate cyclase (GGDEF)-like protein/PAS domain S-box-containing protein
MKRSARKLWSGPVALTMALGVVLTLLLFGQVRSLEHQRVRAEFERAATDRIAALRRALEVQVDVLATVNRLFNTMQPVERAQFEAFTRPMLSKNPQLQLISYQRLVPDPERAAFEATRRRELPGFAITGLVDGRLVPAERRPSYRVADYLVPHEGNEWALGLDANSRHEQDRALRRACASGAAAMTGQYDVVIGNARRPGFMVLMPVYRRGATLAASRSNCDLVAGYTAIAFSSAALFERIVASSGTSVEATLGTRLYAAAGAGLASPVFEARPARARPPGWLATLFDRRPAPLSDTFIVAGQSWHVEVSAAAPMPLRSALGSLLTLGGGMLGSVFAALFAGVLVARRRSVLALVRQRTAELTHVNRSLQLRQQAIDACVNSIIITSAAGPDYPIQYVNPAFEKLNGYSAAEALGRSCAMLWGTDTEQRGVRDVTAVVHARCAGQVLLRTSRKDGSQAWCEMSIAPFKDDSGEIRHFVVVQHDITEKRRYESELEYQATHDALTGLANRTLLHQRLRQEIAAAHGGRKVCVIFLDLDRFKFVNDSLGHRAGNEFLRAVGARLKAAVGLGDTVARPGSDEFVLVLPERASDPAGAAALERIMAAIAQPMMVDGQQFLLGCSVGIARYPDDSEDPETLIEYADLAMYAAKQRGPNQVCAYEPEMNERMRQRLQLERALRGALEAGQFELMYQPQADLCSGRVVGVEVLLCWRHPKLGLVGRERFAALAEETGLIVPIGAWFLERACRQARSWQDAGLGELTLSLDLGARQLQETGLAATVERILGETGLAPHCLQLELTEGLVMGDTAQVQVCLQRLRALGVRLAIDHFGTGYSSLAHLERFPIDALKIDRSFVREVPGPGGASAIPDAIVSMAHSLGMRVIADGVDTEAQCEYLSRNMCDEVQGDLLSPPLAADAMQALLVQGAALPARLLRLHKRERTLLLVDDEPNILAALRRQMRSFGCRVLTAPGGREGLALLETEEVDVIVSDQRMPGMTGVEFLRAVKNSHPQTVRMVLSGFTELQSVTDAVNEGAIYKFLTKPWDDTQLRAHIMEAFRHKEMEDENRRLGLELRAANHGLATANRQLEELLQQQREQMRRDNISLDIVREALQQVPLAIVGLDLEGVVAFANVAAQELFREHGLLLGSMADEFMPAVLEALRGVPDGQPCWEVVAGAAYRIVAHSMGHGTRSRGRLLTFIPTNEDDGRTT